MSVKYPTSRVQRIVTSFGHTINRITSWIQQRTRSERGVNGGLPVVAITPSSEAAKVELTTNQWRYGTVDVGLEQSEIRLTRVDGRVQLVVTPFGDSVRRIVEVWFVSLRQVESWQGTIVGEDLCVDRVIDDETAVLPAVIDLAASADAYV